MDFDKQVDAAIAATPYARLPCIECTLKHLGAAWFAQGADTSPVPVLLERVSILLEEAENGYPEHRILAAGILEHLERFSPDRQAARRVRRDVQNGITSDISGFPAPLAVPPTTRERAAAHLVEAVHESPFELDLSGPLQHTVSDLLKRVK
jgi:hypothetical protein